MALFQLYITETVKHYIFSCISNCAAQINPGARLSVTSKCTDNCEGLKYNWSLSRYNETKKIWQDKDIWPDKTLTKKDSASLVVKAGTFEEKQTYIFILNVTNDHGRYITLVLSLDLMSAKYKVIC